MLHNLAFSQPILTPTALCVAPPITTPKTTADINVFTGSSSFTPITTNCVARKAPPPSPPTQAEEQKAIELQIECQVRQERAYRERLNAQGVDIEEEESHRSEAEGRASSPQAEEPAPSPVPNFSSPRLAPPIGEERDYARRWYQAQQQQGELALRGSAAASPQFSSSDWHMGRSGDGGWGEDHRWEADLDDLMLMEAIRLSLDSGNASANGGSAAMGERVTQLAAQVKGEKGVGKGRDRERKTGEEERRV